MKWEITRILSIIFGFAFVLGFTRSMAGPEAEAFNCSYDSFAGINEIDYSLLGGDAGVTYTVVGAAGGAIEFTEAPPNLTGPNDDDNVSIRCKQAGNGSVSLTFKKAGNTLATCSFCFNCTEENAAPTQISCEVATGPFLGTWGILILLVLLMATSWYIFSWSKVSDTRTAV